MKYLPVAFLLIISLIVSICLVTAIVSVELSQTRPVLGFCYVNNTSHEVIVQFNLNNYTVPNLVASDGPCWVELCTLWKSCNGTSLIYVWPLIAFQVSTVILFFICVKLIRSELDKQVDMEKMPLLNNNTTVVFDNAEIKRNLNALIIKIDGLNLNQYEELSKVINKLDIIEKIISKDE
jgi:hypothetical protein